MARLATIWLLAVLPTALPAADLDTRLAALARAPPATTPYVEVRWSRLMDKPVITSGRLEYPGPGRLTKYTATPYREQVTVDGDRVTIAREGDPVRQLSMARVPELRGPLGGFGALLAGDRAVLERSFALEFTERADGWSLRLTPRDARTRARIRTIDVHGQASEPVCLVVSEPDGDASVLLFGAAPESVPAGVDRAALARRCGQPVG
jgi:hypothetical protein